MSRLSISRTSPLILAVICSGVFGLGAFAQSSTTNDTSSPEPSSNGNAAVVKSVQPIDPNQSMQSQEPDAPGQPTGGQRRDARIYGTVTDPNGNVIAGALVTLEIEPSGEKQSLMTDSTGDFTFSDLAAGTYQISVIAKGFADWAGSAIELSPGRYYQLPELQLQIASANTNVDVVFTTHDLAEEQIKAEEQQRVFGVFPNFYTSYIWRAAPLTSGQKFRLALRTSVDPVNIAVDAATAGIEQAQNDFNGYGQGGEGYARRFGAVYADDVIGTMLGSAVFPSLLHQDPRYFYKGTGTISSRALHAISAVVICRSDSGRREPNYSNIFGSVLI